MDPSSKISESEMKCLREAMITNITDWCSGTAHLRNDAVRYVKEQLIRIMLHNTNMKKVFDTTYK